MKNVSLIIPSLILCALFYGNLNASREAGRDLINLKHMVNQLEEQTQAIREALNKFKQSKTQLNVQQIDTSLNQFSSTINNITIDLSSIELRTELTFDKMKKQYSNNFKRILNADITKAYEYLGMDSAKAHTYTPQDIQQKAAGYDEFMKSGDQSDAKYWQIRQSEVLFGYPKVNALSKEEYDAFLALNAQKEQGPQNISQYLELPDEALLEKMHKIRNDLDQAREQLANIRAQIISDQQQDIKDQQEYVYVPVDTLDLLEYDTNLFFSNLRPMLSRIAISREYTRNDLTEIRKYLSDLDFIKDRAYKFIITPMSKSDNHRIASINLAIDTAYKKLFKLEEERSFFDTPLRLSPLDRVKAAAQKYYKKGISYIATSE